MAKAEVIKTELEATRESLCDSVISGRAGDVYGLVGCVGRAGRACGDSFTGLDHLEVPLFETLGHIVILSFDNEKRRRPRRAPASPRRLIVVSLCPSEPN